MSTRVWYQSMTPLGRLPRYADALARHARRVCQDGVDVTFNGASERWYRKSMPAEVLKYAYAKHVIQAEAIDFSRRAESEGFDAVVLGSFSEPYLAEIRSLLHIPVVSMAEASLLVACSLAEQFALITLAPPNVRRVRSVVRRHGLEGRVSGFAALPRPVHEADLESAFDAPRTLIDEFTVTAQQAVSAGADLVIPAEGVMNEVLFWNGVQTISDATVMDCVGVSLLYAELLVNLKRKVGIGVGRRWAYAMPPAELLEKLQSNR